MKVRLLAPEEYGILADGPGPGLPDDELTSVVAAIDDDGKLAGQMFLVALPHMEAAWVRPDQRGGNVLERMERLISIKSKEFGIPKLFAFAATDAMADYIERLGYKKETMIVYSKEV